VAAPLALPPAAEVLERTKQRDAVVVGTALYGLAAVMVAVGLVGMYTTFRSGVHPWPPAGVRKENYFATMSLFASGMLLVTAEWFAWAVKGGIRRQALQAGIVSVILLAAMLNGILYTAREAGYGAGAHTYAVLFYAFTVVAAVTQVLAIVAFLVGLVRLGGRQLSPSEPQLGRAVAFASHTAALTWVVTWGALYAASR
jgi:heme/copper-type cytochrome/quinol oxidase subunit 3